MAKNGIDRTIGQIQSDISWLKDSQKEILEVLRSGEGKISNLRDRVERIETTKTTEEKMSSKSMIVMSLVFTGITILVNMLFKVF